MGPAITLVIPAYRCAASIRQCLESIRRQTAPVVQVLAVSERDNPDHVQTVAACQEYSADLLEFPHKLGAAGARNAGLRAARTPWVVSVAADLTLDPDCLERLWGARASADAPSRAVVSGRIVEAHRARPGDAWRVAHLALDWGDERLQNTDYLADNLMLFPREAALAIGGYDERFTVAGNDVDFTRRLREWGCTLTYHPEARALHHETDSISRVLRRAWHYCLLYHQSSGHYDRPLTKIRGNFRHALSLTVDDLRHRRWKCLPITLLLPWFWSRWDVPEFRRWRQARGSA